MNDESNERLIIQYRSVAHDEPTTSLDRTILSFARRRAARVRTARRGVALCALLVVAVAVVSVAHRSRQMNTGRIANRTDYGLQEGTTRDYLLTVSAIPPGAIDWR